MRAKKFRANLSFFRLTMAPHASEPKDIRRVVGSTVYAFANKVIHPKSAGRKFGALANSKEFKGIVREIVKEKSGKGNATLTYVVAEFIIGKNQDGSDLTRVSKLNIRSVMAKPTTAASKNPVEPVDVNGNENLQPTATVMRTNAPAILAATGTVAN